MGILHQILKTGIFKLSKESNTLITTPTSSATEHESKVWIFKGWEFLILIGGVIAGIVALVFGSVIFHLQGISAMGFACFPVILTFVYVFFFLLGKPPHYQDDVMEKFIYGSDLDYFPKKMSKLNPLYSFREWGINENS